MSVSTGTPASSETGGRLASVSSMNSISSTSVTGVPTTSNSHSKQNRTATVLRERASIAPGSGNATGSRSQSTSRQSSLQQSKPTSRGSVANRGAPQLRKSSSTTAAAVSVIGAANASLKKRLPLQAFASHVGKIGEAERKRKQASHAVAQANPLRKPPISKPLDYERFVTEKSVQLEGDHRGLLLFPRDDFAESEVFPDERTAIPSVNESHLKTAEWLFTKEALQLYSRPHKVVNFNYAEYSGDFKRIDTPQLGSLRFESDLLADEKASAFTHEKPSEVIAEGYVMVVPNDSGIFDKMIFSEKRRYCIVRRNEMDAVLVDLQKQANVPSNQPPIEVKRVSQPFTKKGREFIQLYGPSTSNGNGNEKPVLVLAADRDGGTDFASWVVSIGQNLVEMSKEDSASIGDARDAASVSNKPAPDTESIGSEGSGGSRDASGAPIWRSKNAVGKALQPPVIDRKNLFALYPELEPLPTETPATSSLLLKPLIGAQSSRSTLSSSSTQTAHSADSGTSIDNNDKNASIPTSPPPVSDRVKKLKVRIEFLSLTMRTNFADDPYFRFEPLFVRLFLFDVATGTRLTEEYKASLVPSHLEAVFREGIAASPQSSPIRITSTPCGTVNDIPYNLMMESKTHQMICAIAAPPNDVFVIVRIERLLSDGIPDVYSKSSIVDQKTALKVSKTAKMTTEKLARYRTPFAWTAGPLIPTMRKPGFPADDGGWQLFKADPKQTEVELQKLLIDCIKTEKSGKLTPIPNASVKVLPNKIYSFSTIQHRISPTLLPLKPWPKVTEEATPTFELQTFGDVATAPYSELVNLLYVYPVSLSFGGQKNSGSRARNISCFVRFISSKLRDGTNAKAIIDRGNPYGPHCQFGNTAVQYHEQNPVFNDEIKVQLPIVVDSSDHLLFTFYHVSVSSAMDQKPQKNGGITTPVGYAWLPLARNGNFLIMSEDVQDFDLPVAGSLVAGYMHYQQLSNGKGHQGPEIKWLDNGRPLFRVRLRLVSSVFTTEDNLQGFFQACNRLYDYRRLVSGNANTSFNGEGPTTSEASAVASSSATANRSCSPTTISESLPSDGALANSHNEEKLFEKIAAKAGNLLNVNIVRLIPHFHVVLQRLFALLPIIHHKDIGTQILGVTIGIVDRASEAGFDSVLRTFVQCHFGAATPGTTASISGEEEPAHAAILKHLVKLLQEMRGEERAMERIFRQLWFFFDVIVKSMAQWLIATRKFKAARRDRFPGDVLDLVTSLVDAMIEAVRRNQGMSEAPAANAALAYFLRFLLALTDRNTVMTLMHRLVDKYDRLASEDSTVSRQSNTFRGLKLDLLRIMAGYEHWIPLSLPLLTDRNNAILRGGPVVGPYSEPPNNASFVSKFFAIFSTTSNSASDHDANALATRFDNYADHFWLSTNYCETHFPVGLLIQELLASLREPRDYRPLVIALVRNLLAKHSADTRYTDQASQGRIALMYVPLLQFAIDNIRELDAAAKVAAEKPEVADSKAAGVTYSTLAFHYSLTHARGAVVSGSNVVGSSAWQASNGNPAVKGNVPSVAATPAGDAGTTLAPLAEKLSKNEARDILVSVLYILGRIPKKTLSTIWLMQEQKGNANGLLEFLHLLELALQMFGYPGRTYLHKVLKKKYHMANKATVNFQFSDRPSRPSSSYDSFPRSSGTLDSQTSSNMSTEAPSSATLTEAPHNDDSESPVAFLKECGLTQEIAITVLDIAQTVTTDVAGRCAHLSSESSDEAFTRLLLLYLRLLDETWPESIRLNALAALSIFVSHFTSRFFVAGPMEPLALVIEAMLLQLNSRYPKIQQASAALLQVVLRRGYEVLIEQRAKESSMDVSYTPMRPRPIRLSGARHQASPPKATLASRHGAPKRGIECLGRPGSQTSVALAYLLGKQQPLATSPFFEQGLAVLESLITSQAQEKRLSPFESAVMELIAQMRGVLSATGALTDAAEDPFRLADLHIQLADSYRGSASLRVTWFDSLAEKHNAENWFSEAAVCLAHSVAIMAKELFARGVLGGVDWYLFDCINRDIVAEENVNDVSMIDTTQQAGYTLNMFTRKIEDLVRALVQAERYEAVGPICRFVIPIFEDAKDFKALVSIYSELQQASSRAAEVKASGKRHLGTYFRVVLHGERHFREDDKTEWIYREPGLTSLAAACERMVATAQHTLGHDRVQVLPENKIDMSALKPDVAYIQMTHVEPCINLPAEVVEKSKDDTVADMDSFGSASADTMNYWHHTNVKHFYYEETLTDDTVPKDAPEMARLSLKRVYLRVKESFPNTRRRSRVMERTEIVLNPLELACDRLRQKANQIRKFLAAAGIPPRCAAIGVDGAAVARIDIKGLQCFLQGAVSPTVNVGVLAYAEAFTTAVQKERYGQEGLEALVQSFKILMTEIQDALEVNAKAIGTDQQEYQEMLQKSFTGMLERLKDFFGDQEFILRHDTGLIDDPSVYGAAYVLNSISIGGVNA
uniref:C2 domain-containing protein n=1 Tax=Panagrellus redivivus TaxID=6233 RepID=A0A7E4UVM3_PANRE